MEEEVIADRGLQITKVMISPLHAFSAINFYDPHYPEAIVDCHWSFGGYYNCDGSNRNLDCVNSGAGPTHTYSLKMEIPMLRASSSRRLVLGYQAAYSVR